MHRMALKIWTSRSTAVLGKCFRALFGIPLGPQSLAHLEAPDGFSNFVRVGQLWFAGMVLEVRLQRHVNRLIDGRDRRNGDRLKLSLQTVGESFSFLRV